MAVQFTIKGAVVAATARDYDFLDQSKPAGQQQVKGTSYALYVVSEFSEAPHLIKVRQSDQPKWAEVEEAGPGTPVTVVCDVNAQNNRVSLTLASLAIGSLV